MADTKQKYCRNRQFFLKQVPYLKITGAGFEYGSKSESESRTKISDSDPAKKGSDPTGFGFRLGTLNSHDDYSLPPHTPFLISVV
jgi:hypothetical protein